MMLGNWSIMFGNPWWLILIPMIVPPLIWMSYRSLAGLGPVRRTLAILFRTAVITLIVLALAELQSIRRTDRLTTMFLLDVSNSMPKDQQKAALDYVEAASKKRRRDNMAGLLVFGREPRVEVPPAPSELNSLGVEEHDRRGEHRPGGRRQAGPGGFPRGSARSDRDHLGRQ